MTELLNRTDNLKKAMLAILNSFSGFHAGLSKEPVQHQQPSHHFGILAGWFYAYSAHTPVNIPPVSQPANLPASCY